ncbi:Wadjet anti-phage system protein JetD domain-containing protein [Arthrobacter sp. Marseille-P9274]|uniref:Wadjet anti-phage system protein JetD domain-containing protein n=1 Tax=Arthrobacter sp. Marseille-P9274 TaxID=2866572 RepID=UPI0021C5E5EE|nr:Wadjet anti-phage system protein JetD domain-containing protein [Arthrobacter sp. Marseille-P9274]
MTPQAARAQVRRKYERLFGSWATSETTSPLLGMPLHPPTERQALADQGSTVAWVKSWTGIEHVVWSERQWASLGRQSVPDRLMLDGPDEVAHFCSMGSHWRRISGRCTRMLEAFPAADGALQSALVRSATELAAMEEDDFTRLFGVLTWLAGNPDSGLYIRQLPIQGVDSKWVGSRRSLVERLHQAITGRSSLGLAAKPELIRLRFLDPELAPGGLRDVSAPLEELVELDVRPRTVFVFENLESVLAMPDWAGTVVIHGSGYAVDRLARIPWVQEMGVVYWGDLDSHGFGILNRLRAQDLDVRTALMDIDTLDAFTDLCVPEPKPYTGVTQHLLSDELMMLQQLAKRGNARLEQERLAWPICLAALSAAAGVDAGGETTSLLGG